MAFYCDIIFPLLNGRADPGVVREHRKSIVARAFGQVLEIGFGTGKSLPYYSNQVQSLTIVEPSAGMNRRTRQLVREASFPVIQRNQTAETLPFGNNSFDCVVTTKTLCSVGQLTTVLSELSRVLKPIGRLMFLEHVKSDNIWVANWQRRLNPIQKRIGCGCHLDREIEKAMQGAGFRVDVLQRLQGGRHAPGTRFMPLIVGEAVHGASVGNR